MGDPANLVESITPPVVTAIPAGEMQDAGKSLLSSKNGKKPDSGSSSSSSSSFFTWFIVLALLGVWTSVAVVYFDLVDYQGVLDKAKGIQINLSETLQGKLAAYDTDGDGDFDVEDAKVLLGLKEKAADAFTRSEDSAPAVDAEDPEPTPEAIVEPDPESVEDLTEDVIEAAVAEETAAPSLAEPEVPAEPKKVEPEPEPEEIPEVTEEDPEVLEEELPAVQEDAPVEVCDMVILLHHGGNNSFLM
ncbi:PREDICTED: aspartyl/asparaginyl beta-hydroxylase-like isoform X7 [Poecilia mexicana]|uniref:aspartyl/asparaginyl beta-hydroxylase-like isoform X7 n=1 Tax=Poecilia mexicana TaxID=48701 RepID=UPI00072EAD2F|nr:PREDICTED: aspartyl/asparaginyl beta-hydroxylase-like isoform X7 [Poecilia mexicana]